MRYAVHVFSQTHDVDCVFLLHMMPVSVQPTIPSKQSSGTHSTGLPLADQTGHYMVRCRGETGADMSAISTGDRSSLRMVEMLGVAWGGDR